jgi:hypothetical protein
MFYTYMAACATTFRGFRGMKEKALRVMVWYQVDCGHENLGYVLR